MQDMDTFKVKRATIAAEARIIRALERSRARTARNLRAKGKASDLSESARLSLYMHRMKVVRPAARAMHLAYNYMKGTPYEKVEGTQRSLVTAIHFATVATAVAKEIGTFGKPEIKNTTLEVRTDAVLRWMGQK
jgi:hypothetical protein